MNRRDRRLQREAADRRRVPAGPPEAVLSARPSPAPDTGPPAGCATAPADHRPLPTEATTAGDIEALLRLRPAAGWTDAERREVATLAARMAELRDISARLDAEGLTVTTPTGRTLVNPLVRLRAQAETAIRRTRTALGLTTSIGEARREGRRMAQRQGDEFGRLPDGSWTPTLAYALDPDELLARPEPHDYEAEQALYWKLCERGEITPDGEAAPGGVLWRDMHRTGSASN